MDRWYSSLLPKELLSGAEVRVRSKHNSLCILCRGGRHLCGKSACPIELKARAYIRNLNVINTKEFVGSSPPSVFVGRFGYPYVYAGPMVPPFLGDTEIMDIPEAWLGKPVDTIVNYRYSLIRGSTRLPIDAVRRGGRTVESLQELSMGSSTADTQMELLKRPTERIYFDDNSQPFGPSAPLKSFEISSIRVDQKIEKAFYDGDLRASEAVIELYDSGLKVSRLQRAFSMGVFGLSKNRKMVPTRWSITAVDSLLSQRLIGEIKKYETIDKYMVYIHSYQHNTFAAILMPMKWSFEWMEAWFPRTFWNLKGEEAAVIGDAEGYYGRKAYPDIGGCYFSTRLGVAEHLKRIRRQATVLVVREIMPEFPLPLGVWFVRENIRSMFKGAARIFDDLRSCLKHLKNFLVIPPARWVEESALLREAILQRRIDDYLRYADLQG